MYLVKFMRMTTVNSFLRLHALLLCESCPFALTFRPHAVNSLHHNSPLDPTFVIKRYTIPREITQAPFPVVAFATNLGIAMPPPLHPVRAIQRIEVMQLGMAAARMSSAQREGAEMARGKKDVAHSQSRWVY